MANDDFRQYFKGFKIEVWATGIPGARAMVRGDQGKIYIGTRGLGRVYEVTDAGDKRTSRVLRHRRRARRPSLGSPWILAAAALLALGLGGAFIASRASAPPARPETPTVRAAPASRVAKTAGSPSVATRVTVWKPASRASFIVSSQPSEQAFSG